MFSRWEETDMMMEHSCNNRCKYVTPKSGGKLQHAAIITIYFEQEAHVLIISGAGRYKTQERYEAFDDVFSENL